MEKTLRQSFIRSWKMALGLGYFFFSSILLSNKMCATVNGWRMIDECMFYCLWLLNKPICCVYICYGCSSLSLSALSFLLSIFFLYIFICDFRYCCCLDLDGLLSFVINFNSYSWTIEEYKKSIHARIQTIENEKKETQKKERTKEKQSVLYAHQ